MHNQKVMNIGLDKICEGSGYARFCLPWKVVYMTVKQSKVGSVVSLYTLERHFIQN